MRLPLTLLALPAIAAAAELEYPVTKRVDHTDTYHGTVVPDPYRWLEDDVRESDDVAKWVEEQNKVTFAYLESLPERQAIEDRLTALWDYEKYSAPFKRGGRYYFSKNDGLQNQSVLYVQKTLDDEPAVLIDPNEWSDDGTIALGGIAFSDDGQYAAYGVAEAGSDWYTWRVMEIETRRVLDDEINWVKYSGAEWAADSSGFYYGRFDEPQDGEAFQSLTYNQKVYFHKIGTRQSEDTLVYERPDEPEWGFGVDATEDGRYLVLTVWKGTDNRYRILYKDLESDGEFVDLIDTFEYDYSIVGSEGSRFFFVTSNDAPKKRLIAIDVTKPEPEHWTELIPEQDEPLRGVSLVGESFITQYLKDAKTEIIVHDMTGNRVREVELPGIGSAGGFSGKREDMETFYSFSSFATPPSIYRYDIATGESTLMRRAEVDCNPEDYIVTQVFYTSKDGTRVPMFITHKKGIELNGKNPTMLYGYGGFNISITPGFSPATVGWVDAGGVYAVANLRGGGEYGRQWHEDGMRLKKQNVFDDCIAAAECLIEKGYTSPSRLSLSGRSNGGLLVGAVMTQRPDLFGAVLPQVGVMDMLRYHKFTIGWAWATEFGSSDEEDQIDNLLSYSPLHNLKPGVCYPATLITTADRDDRVVPGHSFKFAAALQAAQSTATDCDHPTLIRIETRAGHGAGKPTAKLIEEAADQIAFAWAHTAGK
jgi:prolyl oligopeptidase